MKVEGTIYRPPVEAHTFLLQVASGCTHNACRFCTMFRDKRFHLIDTAIIEENLEEVLRDYGPYAEQLDRIFLTDGDVFALSADRLEALIQRIRRYLPHIRTFTMYAAVRNIKHKTDEELLRLRDLGVNDLYVGYESGLDDMLAFMNKGQTVEECITQADRLNRIGIRHHALMIIGMAGKGRGEESGIAAAKLLNRIKPGITLLTTLSIFPGSDLRQDVEAGRFVPAGEKEILLEEKTMLEQLTDPNLYFWASHSLNSTPIEGYVGQDRDWMLEKLNQSMSNMDESQMHVQRDHL